MAIDDVRPDLDDDWFRKADAYQGDRIVRKGDATTTSVEPPVAVPIDASGSATAVALRTLAFQVIGFVGLLIGVLGLSENSWVVKIYNIARSDQAIPVIFLLCGMIASGWQLIRGLVKHRKFQVMSMLLPQEVAKSPDNPSPAVVTAAKAAIVAETAGVDDLARFEGEQR